MEGTDFYIWSDKLRSLASDFYAPFSSLVSTSRKRFLLSDSPSSLDALLYGHLILHLQPVLPDPTLRSTLIQSHPELVGYLERCHAFFETKFSQMTTIKDESGLKNLFRGWGYEQGRRKEDLLGIGAFIGVIICYATWNTLRRP
jgi:hypothetical protein